jgi:hypothetical protein
MARVLLLMGLECNDTMAELIPALALGTAVPAAGTGGVPVGAAAIQADFQGVLMQILAADPGIGGVAPQPPLLTGNKLPAGLLPTDAGPKKAEDPTATSAQPPVAADPSTVLTVPAGAAAATTIVPPFLLLAQAVTVSTPSAQPAFVRPLTLPATPAELAAGGKDLPFVRPLTLPATPAELAAGGKDLPPGFASATPSAAISEETVEMTFSSSVRALAGPRVSDPSGNRFSPPPVDADPHLAPPVPAAAQVPTPPPVPSSPVPVRIGEAGWQEAFVDRVVWFAGERQSVAEIRVYPPQLGPVEVRLSFSQGETSALIVAPHAAARDAIDTALPRLREMFAEAGIHLGQVQVGDGSGGSRGHPTPPDFLKPTLPATDEQNLRVVAITRGLPRGLVDLYA